MVPFRGLRLLTMAVKRASKVRSVSFWSKPRPETETENLDRIIGDRGDTFQGHRADTLNSPFIVLWRNASTHMPVSRHRRLTWLFETSVPPMA